MDFNFFDWIRKGVRNAVLLGVHDAVDSIGSPQAETDIKEQLATLMGDGSQATIGVKPKRKSRKKLGKGLAQIQSES